MLNCKHLRLNQQNAIFNEINRDYKRKKENLQRKLKEKNLRGRL